MFKNPYRRPTQIQILSYVHTEPFQPSIVSCSSLRFHSLVDLYSERQQAYDSFYRREVEEDVKEVTVLWDTIPDFYVKR